MGKETELSDESLIEKSLSGDRRSFEVIVKRYSSKLYLFIRQRTFSDEEAEDLVQETFFKVYKNIENFNPAFRFSTWLYTIAFRLTVDSARRLKTRISQLELSRTEKSYSNSIGNFEKQSVWESAIRLKEKYYRVLRLRYDDEMSIKEISGIIGKSQINTRVILHRARLELQKILTEIPEKSTSNLGPDSLELNKGE